MEDVLTLFLSFLKGGGSKGPKMGKIVLVIPDSSTSISYEVFHMSYHDLVISIKLLVIIDTEGLIHQKRHRNPVHDLTCDFVSLLAEN